MSKDPTVSDLESLRHATNATEEACDEGDELTQTTKFLRQPKPTAIPTGLKDRTTKDNLSKALKAFCGSDC